MKKDIYDIAEDLENLSNKLHENYKNLFDFLEELKEDYETMNHFKTEGEYGIDIRYIIDRLADLLGQKGTSTYL